MVALVGRNRALLGRALPETRSLINRMTGKPTTARIRLIDTLYRALKSAGVLPKLDGLYLIGHDSQASRLNWAGPNYNLSAVASPTIVADRYFAGDGSSAYLDTVFNPTTAVGAKFTLNSAHLHVWSVSELQLGTAFDIGNTQARMNARSPTGDTIRGLLNDATLVSYGAAATSIGDFLLNRSASNALQAYRNGVSLGTATTAATALHNSNICILGNIAGLFSNRRVTTASFGGSLTAGESLAFYAARNTYLTAIGAV